MPGNLANKRALRNLTEWRSGYWRTYTSFAADLNFSNDGPNALSSVGTKVPAAEVHVLATVAGNVVLTRPDGTDITMPCAVGWNVFPCSPIGMKTAGSTVTGTMIVYW